MSGGTDRPESIDKRFKRALAEQLCAMLEGWNQVEGGAWVGLRQPAVSALRNGEYEHISIARLLRCIAEQRHYNLELHLRPIDRPFAQPKKYPTVTVIRYDRFGRPV
jgi:hypothetical protein